MAVINLAQVASPSAPSASTDNIFIDTSGNLSVQKPDGNIVKLAAAGTYTLTIPATGTAALRDAAQTFSEAQTFSNRLVAPGMQPASDGTAALTLTDAGGTAVLTVDTTNSRVIGTEFCIGNTANRLREVSQGVVRQEIRTVSLANDATLTVSTEARGIVMAYNGSSGAIALVGVGGSTATIIYQNGASFTTTAGNAGTTNIYPSGGWILLQNKVGSAQLYRAYVLN